MHPQASPAGAQTCSEDCKCGCLLCRGGGLNAAAKAQEQLGLKHARSLLRVHAQFKDEHNKEAQKAASKNLTAAGG